MKLSIVLVLLLFAVPSRAQDYKQTPAQCRANYDAWNIEPIGLYNISIDDLDYRHTVLMLCTANDYNAPQEKKEKYLALANMYAYALLDRYVKFVERHHLTEQLKKEDQTAGNR